MSARDRLHVISAIFLLALSSTNSVAQPMKNWEGIQTSRNDAITTTPLAAEKSTLSVSQNDIEKSSTKAEQTRATPPFSPMTGDTKEILPPIKEPEPSVTLSLLPGSARMSSALSEFARDNGWELAWEIDRDFPIDYAATFEGPFLDVIASVVESLRATDTPLRAKVYRANKVVRIIHATR